MIRTFGKSKLVASLAVVGAVIGLLLIPVTVQAEGATLKLTPTSGTFEVGSLIDVSIVVDTGGEAINAVSATLLFPPEKLQVVNPAASTSFISIWVTAPTYSNTDGTVSFEGGLPNPGLKTGAGVVSTVTFRVKGTGAATLKFAPSARVLKNDGNGTNILTSTGSASLVLKMPPPAGPVVTSSTHSDQSAWYNNPQIQFVWEGVDGAVGYSYVFDQSPKTIPPEQVATTTTAAGVKATGDGAWFFHVRAKTDIWGGVTTFPVQIDTTPPAAFTPRLDKSLYTVADAPILTFTTTDAASGIDHYEVKIVNKSPTENGANTLFVEAASPYSVSKLTAGEYNFIVRAIDRAGNVVDGMVSTKVVSSGTSFYARVPLLQNPAVANIALLSLATLVLILLVVLILRRWRLQSTVRHDLEMLSRDAQHKAEELNRELAELRSVQQLTQTDVKSNPPANPPTMTSNKPNGQI